MNFIWTHYLNLQPQIGILLNVIYNIARLMISGGMIKGESSTLSRWIRMGGFKLDFSFSSVLFCFRCLAKVVCLSKIEILLKLLKERQKKQK